MGIDATPRLTDYMSFAIFLPLGFGLAFQLPLAMLVIERIGICSIGLYLSQWRAAVLIIAFVSMILTPAEPTSMIACACRWSCSTSLNRPLLLFAASRLTARRLRSEVRQHDESSFSFFRSLSIQPRFARADSPTMTHGPMLGKPTSNSMRVWARTSEPSEFEVRFGTSKLDLSSSARSAVTSWSMIAPALSISDCRPKTRDTFIKSS